MKGQHRECNCRGVKRRVTLNGDLAPAGASNALRIDNRTTSYAYVRSEFILIRLGIALRDPLVPFPSSISLNITFFSSPRSPPPFEAL